MYWKMFTLDTNHLMQEDIVTHCCKDLENKMVDLCYNTFITLNILYFTEFNKD